MAVVVEPVEEETLTARTKARVVVVAAAEVVSVVVAEADVEISVTAEVAEGEAVAKTTVVAAPAVVASPEDNRARTDVVSRCPTRAQIDSAGLVPAGSP